MAAIEFWYEFASTYSYPAAMRAEAVAGRQGVAVRWRPFLLGPIFATLGWTTSPFNLQPAKGAYMWRDVERTCLRLGLTFSRPDPFPQNGLLAARASLALPDDGARAGFTRAIYHAAFAGSRQIAERDTIAALLAAEGHDAETILTRAATPVIKDALRAATAEAQAIGVFGAPTWRTPDGEIFWGNDRLEDALDWMERTALEDGS